MRTALYSAKTLAAAKSACLGCKLGWCAGPLPPWACQWPPPWVGKPAQPSPTWPTARAMQVAAAGGGHCVHGAANVCMPPPMGNVWLKKDPTPIQIFSNSINPDTITDVHIAYHDFQQAVKSQLGGGAGFSGSKGRCEEKTPANFAETAIFAISLSFFGPNQVPVAPQDWPISVARN